MNTLEDIRQKINVIDEELLSLFAKRFSLARQIGQYKKTHGLPIVDNKKEAVKIQTLKKIGKTKNVSLTFIDKAWETVFAETYKIEGNI